MTVPAGALDRAVIPANRYQERLGAAADAARRAGLGALLIGVGPDLAYLTGYRAMPLERLTMLVLVPDRPPAIVVPRLERPAAEAGLQTAIRIAPWDETADPYRLVVDLVGGTSRPVGVSDRLWARHLLALEERLPASFEPASQVLRDLRMVKDQDEIELLRLAAEAADRVIASIAAGPLVGRPEADVAREVRDRLVDEGHDEAAFAIVASGP
ncbi:MAG: M24 family metallopeptidase, partial [Chloroflexota bacterium]